MSGRMLFVIVLTSFLLNMFVVLARFPSEPHNADAMWIEPSTATMPASCGIGYRFNVTVYVNLTFVSGAWEFKMLYERNRLNCTGCWYTAGTKSQFFENISSVGVSPSYGAYDATRDRVQFGESWTGLGPMRSPGYGSLARVEFEVVAEPSENQTLTSWIDISTCAQGPNPRTRVIDELGNTVVISAYDAEYVFAWTRFDAFLFPTCPPPYVPSNQTRIRESVLVKVNVTGFVVEQVVLKFRKQGEQWFNVSMLFNGTEGFWTQTIPAQTENCTVEFFAEAYDELGASTVSSVYSFRVKALPLGDLNGDNYVGIDDIYTAAQHFAQEIPEEPEDP